MQTPLLVDADWQGQPRKLLLHANRNGFFYVLDRVTGKLLLAKPFVKKLTWASGIDAEGRPVRIPDQEPTAKGNNICPTIEGATNWFSSSFHPETGLLYLQALEKCGIFTKTEVEWKPGKDFMAGTTKNYSRRRAPEIPARSRYPNGQSCLGSPAGWESGILGRRPQHGRWRCILLRRQRRVRGSRRSHGKAALAIPGQSTLEGFADDLYVRRKAIRRGGLGPNDHCLCTSGIASPTKSRPAPDARALRPGSTQFRTPACPVWSNTRSQ